MDFFDKANLDSVASAGAVAGSDDTAYNPGLLRFASVAEAVKTLLPEQPVQCLHPDRIALQARTFIDHFPGASLYAVKANPDPYVLQHLWQAGIRHFDVASLNEVKLVRGLFPAAHLAFMHPIKSREAIRVAYFDYGVRDFVIDTFEELHKILEETKTAADLTILVRLDMPLHMQVGSAAPLAGKFGCAADVAASLLRDADRVAHKVGLSFHVGSQSLDPQSYAGAIRLAGTVVKAAGVTLDVLDVGGGFPIAGLGMDVPPLTEFFDVIRHEVAQLKLPPTCALWCEPGRALSGPSTTLLVRVELRKGDVLYLNDGSFGNMFEVASMQWRNTAQLLRPVRKGRQSPGRATQPFRFYGPTCDSVDYMPGPFQLPADVCEGDWIALDGMGSYMAASQSRFNGFYSDLQVEIAGEPVPAVRRRSPRRAASRLADTDSVEA